MDKWYVYHIHPKCNDSVFDGYIGISMNPSRRYRDHINRKGKTQILMEGLSSPHTLVRLHECDSKLEAEIFERIYRPSKHMGWNYAAGGGGNNGAKSMLGKLHTTHSKLLISKNRKGKGGQFGPDNPMYGNGFSGEANPMYGTLPWDNPKVKDLTRWEQFRDLYRLWISCDKPRAGNFRKIATTNGFVDIVYDGMIRIFDDEQKCNRYLTEWEKWKYVQFISSKQS